MPVVPGSCVSRSSCVRSVQMLVDRSLEEVYLARATDAGMGLDCLRPRLIARREESDSRLSLSPRQDKLATDQAGDELPWH